MKTCVRITTLVDMRKMNAVFVDSGTCAGYESINGDVIDWNALRVLSNGVIHPMSEHTRSHPHGHRQSESDTNTNTYAQNNLSRHYLTLLSTAFVMVDHVGIPNV